MFHGFAPHFLMPAVWQIQYNNSSREGGGVIDALWILEFFEFFTV
jgi:hypothetical protein